MVAGNALARFSSANTEQTGHLDFNIGIKKWAFVTSFTYANYGDLRSGPVGGVDYFYRPSCVKTIDNKDYMVPILVWNMIPLNGICSSDLIRECNLSSNNKMFHSGI